MNAYLWMVKGFGGLVQTLEEMSEAREKMDEATLVTLESWLARLARVVEIQKRMNATK